MTKEEKLIGKEFKYNHPKFGLLDLIFIEVMERDSKYAYLDCDHCGKPLKSRLYVFVTKEENYEYMFGSECVKEVFKEEVK